jgi:hypothetical protein
MDDKQFLKDQNDRECLYEQCEKTKPKYLDGELIEMPKPPIRVGGSCWDDELDRYITEIIVVPRD